MMLTLAECLSKAITFDCSKEFSNWKSLPMHMTLIFSLRI
ncbi:hypothetical protein HMPREF3205_01775 [Streptococcus pasteurianus]|nr:hypothetical protein HMPREF3205_01775 [Streptococcus pasteurianus]